MEVRWTNGARIEYATTLTHLKQDMPKLALTIRNKVKKIARLLEHFPYLGQQAVWAGEPDVREFFIRQYRLVYRVTPACVVISAFVPVGAHLRL